MYTFGFSWKIWKSAKPIATAEAILDYLKEAAEEQVILQAISLKSALEKPQHCDQTLAYTCTGFRPLAINFWNLTGNHR